VVRRRRAVAGVHPWLKESAGRSHPLGATVAPDGVNFSVFSKGSTAVHLLLFDGVNDDAPSRAITLDPHAQRTYHYWHAFVPDIRPGQVYAYRANGPWDPARGLRFDPGKLLLDPYGQCVVSPALRSRDDAKRPGDNTATAFKNLVVDPRSYDWEDDRPPQTPFTRTVIYEMHVGAFTRHPNSGVGRAKRGTYAGVIEKIPYLLDLGVTAVELLPIFAFDDQDAPSGLRNDWGYAPVSFFAPHEGYSSRRDGAGIVNEFRDMVKAFHRVGIEVILDVVYNHTAEGGETGPTQCFRGLADGTYYMLDADRRTYANYSGCGNTLNANDPIVRRLILDSLRYWAGEMHVDGFRFDLASILARDAAGQPMAAPPVLWDIESDPVLANVKLIAEAWDAGGLYQVGSFVGDSWKEWNGQFRDDVRAFLKSDRGRVQALASRLTGSPDIYAHEQREPEQSINFVTCHDGFTLNDLVSYNTKHNDANGENNRDGADDNRSWNCGVEGPSDDPEIERLRNRQVKNFLTLLMVGVGTPMLLMGDEVRRTQRGNNNAYCQNNEISWFDWSLVDRHADVRRFAKTVIQLRTDRRLSDERRGLTLVELLRRHPVDWHGVRLNEPDWGHDSHTLSMSARLVGGTRAVQLIANAYWEPLAFALPDPPVVAGRWRLLVDTSRDAPGDAYRWESAPGVEPGSYLVEPRTVVLLYASAAETHDDSFAR
jgi:glycogen operon protein